MNTQKEWDMKTNETLRLDKGEAHIIDGVCVNSKHRARFLANENEEYCQCSFGDCKVMVSISYNGHDPYMYILTEQEIKSLPIMEIKEIPQMKGTRDAIDGLTLKKTQKEWKNWKDNFCQHISDWSYFSAEEELEKIKNILLQKQKDEILEKIEKDLLDIADKNELEELRREVVNYFKKHKKVADKN